MDRNDELDLEVSDYVTWHMDWVTSVFCGGVVKSLMHYLEHIYLLECGKDDKICLVEKEINDRC